MANTAETRALAPGTVLDGRFVLDRRCGPDETWLATDRVLQRTVSVKVLRDDGVGAFLDLGHTDDGTPYLVFQAVDGATTPSRDDTAVLAGAGDPTVELSATSDATERLPIVEGPQLRSVDAAPRTDPAPRRDPVAWARRHRWPLVAGLLALAVVALLTASLVDGEQDPSSGDTPASAEVRLDGVLDRLAEVGG